MITPGVCVSFKQEILLGVHQPGDTYKIALYPSSANLDDGVAAYSAAGEVPSTGGYTAGGIALAGLAVSLDGKTAILTFASPIWPSPTTITARGALIYNATRANRAVAVLDFGRDVISTNGEYRVTTPPATAGTGLIRIA